NPYALIANFDISHINLIVSYSDGSQSLVPLSYDMLSSIDINKLFVEGLQDITVKYGDLTTTFIIAMFAEYPSVENNELSQNEAIFYEVMSMLENNHFSEPDTEALYLGAMNGMIESLEDPYTIYYSHEEFERRQDGLSESYVGIGIAIANIDNQLVITRVVSGGPAEKAGIQTNDIIRIIKGVEVTKDNIFDIVNTLFGELGETLNIKIERAGVEGLIEFQIDYEIIDVPTVESRTVMDGEDIISIIKVNSFGSETADIFENAVVTAEEENIQGMVIDLRNNGGGYLSAVVQMMQIFLIDDAKAILTFESYSNGFSINTFYGGQTEKKPYDIVVLVNENSASASEVFSLAMQEHGNYTVVGKQTYGKGVGQFSLPLSESVGDYLTITHAKWYGPDGTWVHRNGGTNGVVPDVIAEHNELESLWKIYLSNDEVIEYNTVDQRTERIQVILNGMGYNLRTDGYYDLQTQAAIEDIQTQNALTMTGNIDQMTIQIINQWLDDYQANIDTQLEKAIDQLNN
ncbi:MAG TPA: S41 family peptidase, partial [Candidatus Izemoplasmatales bacterium]|nr:S41 family peptidase [Candidatus Izemoplasmatales bacterium]